MAEAGVLIIKYASMKQQFEAALTGTDGPVDGIIRHLVHKNHDQAYEFRSLDDTLHLVIAMDDNGQWQRIAGSEPYLSGWVDQMAELVTLAK